MLYLDGYRGEDSSYLCLLRWFWQALVIESSSASERDMICAGVSVRRRAHDMLGMLQQAASAAQVPLVSWYHACNQKSGTARCAPDSVPPTPYRYFGVHFNGHHVHTEPPLRGLARESLSYSHKNLLLIPIRPDMPSSRFAREIRLASVVRCQSLMRRKRVTQRDSGMKRRGNVERFRHEMSHLS